MGVPVLGEASHCEARLPILWSSRVHLRQRYLHLRESWRRFTHDTASDYSWTWPAHDVSSYRQGCGLHE
jgi:hypothetical protein